MTHTELLSLGAILGLALWGWLSALIYERARRREMRRRVEAAINRHKEQP